MTTKELFQKNDQLCRQLLSVTRSDWFENALIYAHAVAVESEPNPTPDFCRGVLRLKTALMSLGEPEPTAEDLPGSGINHNFDQPKPPTS